MIKVAVVEDQSSYAECLQAYLQRYARENDLEIQIRHYTDGMNIAEGYEPVWDLILMDIDMPLLDGMSAARSIRKKDQTALIIFITNMAQYAIEGYEVEALDYVLKPIQYPAFALKLRKAFRILESRPKDYVILSKEGETVKLFIQNIYYIEVFDHRLIYHTVDGEYSSFDTLGNVEKKLGKCFARCSRSYLLNLHYVNAVQNDSVVVKDDTLKIGRTRKKEFLEKLTDYYQNGGR